MICPDCGNTELTSLVKGIWQCPKCNKIIKKKIESKPEEVRNVTFESGEFFMKNTGLNKKYEICEKGIIISKTPKLLIAALICYSPDFPSSKYIRISWFKNSIYLHAGMIKITESSELNNLIDCLEKINTDYDQDFNFKPKKSEVKPNIEEQEELFRLDGNKCPKCSSKMKKNKNNRYFDCQVCGEIVVLEDGRPIFDIPSDKLPLSYSSNFPVNYYIPEKGITFKWLMGEWKSTVIIYDQSNPDRKFLRFYWWTRNLQDYISSEFTMGDSAGASFKWSARKGVGTTNIYDKELIVPIINALKLEKKELTW